MSFEERRRDIIKHGEGSIPHMYLDTVGKVTVAVGNMLPNAGAAQALVFVKRGTDERAAADEIKKDFDAVAAQPVGRIASSYRGFTALDMPERAIDELLDARIAGFEAGLCKDFPDYDSSPDAAKIGLMDMAFNLGNHGLVTKFPSFCRAARAKDWAGCERECNRRGISDARNDQTRALFREAACRPLRL